MPGKVSIIMPAYNCSKFIKESIQSVQQQTYIDWELIIVNDCSTDNTAEIIDNLAKHDTRILRLKNEKNLGAAASRNIAVQVSTGKYIAFLDSDDIWVGTKLEQQIKFMEDSDFSFTCTSYDKINERGENLGRVVQALNLNYEGLLKRCPGNSTVIYNAEALGKFTIPSIQKRNDYVMWLQVIKKANELHGLNIVLGSHRIGMNSLSSNKISLLKYHWIIYRKIENLTVLRSMYLVWFWIAKGVLKWIRSI